MSGAYSIVGTVAVAMLLGVVAFGPSHASTTMIAFPDFSDVSSLTFNGSAVQQGTALRLTTLVNSQAGTVYVTAPIGFTGSTSFNSQFSFLAQNAGGADGICAILQNQGVNAVGGSGGGLGISGIVPSVGICADMNPFVNDSIRIRVNGSTVQQIDTPFMMRTTLTHMWIDYDSTTDLLEVFVANNSTKPGSPLLTRTIAIDGVLGAQAFLGFTGATGSFNNDHFIYSWTFVSCVSTPTVTATATATATATPTTTATATATTTATPPPTATATATTTASITATVAPTGSPTPTPTSATAPVCPTSPATGCKVPTAGKLIVKNNTDDGKDGVTWKFSKGPLLIQSDFGDPLNTNGYAFCVYDDGTKKIDLTIPSGMLWAAVSTKGYQYKDPAGTNDSVTKLKLLSGAAGKSKLQLKGKGPGLGIPVMPASPTQLLSGGVAVVVQLHGNGDCWETTFTSAQSTHKVSSYKGKF